MGIFEFLVPDAEDPRLIYEGIGIETIKQGEKRFVKCVYDGGPAAKAGLLYGDELLAVDGEPWAGLRSFRGKSGGSVMVTVRRAEGAAPLEEPSTVPLAMKTKDSAFADAAQRISPNAAGRNARRRPKDASARILRQ